MGNVGTQETCATPFADAVHAGPALAWKITSPEMDVGGVKESVIELPADAVAVPGDVVTEVVLLEVVTVKVPVPAADAVGANVATAPTPSARTPQRVAMVVQIRPR